MNTNAATQPTNLTIEEINRHIDHAYYVATQSIGLMHLLSIAATGTSDPLTKKQAEGIMSLSNHQGIELQNAFDACEATWNELRKAAAQLSQSDHPEFLRANAGKGAASVVK